MSNQPKTNNVSPINIDNEDRSAERQFKRHVQAVHRRRVTVLLGVLALISLLFGGRIYQANKTQAVTKQSVLQQKQKLTAAKNKNADLQNEIQQLHRPEYLDNLIRYRFNYSKNGEIIYNIPNESNKNLNF